MLNQAGERSFTTADRRCLHMPSSACLGGIMTDNGLSDIPENAAALTLEQQGQNGPTTPTETASPGTSSVPPSDAGVAATIAGLSVLKGLVLYGATLAFAGFYAYFMEQIVSASGTPPSLNSAMVAAAAALAGILGS